MRLFRVRIRRLVLVSVLMALAIHAGLLGLLGLRGFPQIEPTPEPTMAVTLTQVEQSPGQSPKVDDAELKEQIDRASRRFASRSREQNQKTLGENTRWLERNSSEQAVSDISAVVRRASGAPVRAYEPVDPPPAGEFDMSSMLLYSTQKIAGEDGLERTQQTWIDKDGRAMKQTSRKAISADGAVRYYHGVYMADGRLEEFETDQDPLGGAGGILDQVSASPLLQRLYREAFLPLFEAQRKSATSPAQAPR